MSKIARSQQKLSDLAHLVCMPDGIVTTGWAGVEAQAARLGVRFDRWQAGIGALALGRRADGQYAAGIGGVCISIPRQTGKTYTFGWLIFVQCLLNPGLLAVWTAHHTRTSDETFTQMKSMAQQSLVAGHVESVRSANGQQGIVFKNGSRILFGAREQGFGRGFAKVDILAFDEAQILTEAALSDMVPATNAAPNGLVFMFGTPPRPKDPGEAFILKRNSAISGDPDTLWVEFSADPDCGVENWEPSYVDWQQVEKANPSFPHRTSKNAVLRMRKLIGSNENFRREALGIWDESGKASRLISAVLWDSTVKKPPAGGVKSFAVAFSRDGERQAVAGVVKHAKGVHANLISTYTGATVSGVASLADWLAKRWRSTGMIAISGAAGAAALAQALADRGVPRRMVRVLNSREYFAACQMLVESIKDGTFSRPEARGEDDALEASVAVVDAKLRGRDGSWGWEATSIDGDETPVEALSVGVWAAKANRRIPGRKQVALS